MHTEHSPGPGTQQVHDQCGIIITAVVCVATGFTVSSEPLQGAWHLAGGGTVGCSESHLGRRPVSVGFLPEHRSRLPDGQQPPFSWDDPSLLLRRAAPQAGLTGQGVHVARRGQRGPSLGHAGLEPPGATSSGRASTLQHSEAIGGRRFCLGDKPVRSERKERAAPAAGMETEASQGLDRSDTSGASCHACPVAPPPLWLLHSHSGSGRHPGILPAKPHFCLSCCELGFCHLQAKGQRRALRRLGPLPSLCRHSQVCPSHTFVHFLPPKSVKAALFPFAFNKGLSM